MIPNAFTLAECRDMVKIPLSIDPRDKTGREKIDRIITYAAVKFWKAADWQSLFRAATVNVYDGYVFSPPGYGRLYKANLSNRPIRLQDSFFEFHLNGPGSVHDANGKNWTDSIIDAGAVPVMFQPGDRSCDYNIAIRPHCTESGTVKVYGKYFGDHSVLEHKKEQLTSPQVTDRGFFSKGSIVGYNQQGIVEPIQSQVNVSDQFVELDLSHDSHLIDDVVWKQVDQISKPITTDYVDVLFVDQKTGKSEIAATIGPRETKSLMYKYRIPQCSEYDAVYGLWKVSKPNAVRDGDLTIFNDEEVLISMCKWAKANLFGGDLQEGASWLTLALSAESTDVNSRSTNPIPIQIDHNEREFKRQAIIDGY